MEAIRARYAVPQAVQMRQAGADLLAWVPPFESCVRAVAAGADSLPGADRGGRAPLRRIDTPDASVLVREYRKGGLLRGLRGRAFRGRWRPLDELVLTRRLRSLGLPVAEAVGCVVRRVGSKWRGWLLLVEHVGSVDLGAFVAAGAPGGLRDRRVVRSAGHAVRDLHDAGIEHADLHPKNLLLTADGRVVVLDLDRAVAHDRPLGAEARAKNLARLHRSVEKARLRGAALSPRLLLGFLRAYAAESRAGRAWFERLRLRWRRVAWLQILGWHLTGGLRRADVSVSPAAPARSRGVGLEP